MRKPTLLMALFAYLSFSAYSQIIFEKGYFIDKFGQKTECLIKNVEWKINPTLFEYKLTDETASQTAVIQDVIEFGIYGASVYTRAHVDIDRSAETLNNLGDYKYPTFQRELLFLKLLIRGNASLFIYEDKNLTRFFYTMNDSDTSQLVYKRYLVKDQIATNNHFREQLRDEFQSRGLSLSNADNISYSKKALKKVFINYNEGANSDFVDYEPTQKKDLFNLSLRPGINLNHLTVNNSIAEYWYTDFGPKADIRLGVEAEFILPFNKNKWRLILEPTYQQYESEKTKQTSTVYKGFFVSKVNYQSIEMPIGLRHYFYLNDQSTVFVDVTFVFDVYGDSYIEFFDYKGSVLNSLEIKTRRNFAFGLGYKFKERFSLEIRHHKKSGILADYVYWNSDYRTFSVILGYTLF